MYPKTAGSTISAGLSAIVGGTHTLDMRLKRSVPIASLTEEDKADIHLISGHFEFGMHEVFQRKPLYIAAVREPVERAVSGYRFLVGNTGHEDHRFVEDRDFEEAWHAQEAHYGASRHNHQSKMLMGGDPNIPVRAEDLWQRVEDAYFLVIPSSRVNHALQHLRAAFGVAWSRIIPQNISRSDQVDPSDDMRRKILEINALDAELYQRAERDFDASLKRACDYVASHCLLPLKDSPD